VLRELDLIQKALEKHSEKIDALSENVTGLKVKIGFFSTIFGAIGAMIASIFK
jgi:hypothetical protein